MPRGGGEGLWCTTAHYLCLQEAMLAEGVGYDLG